MAMPSEMRRRCRARPAGAQESMQRHATSTGYLIRGQDFRGGPAPAADRAGDGAAEALMVRGFAGEEERALDRLGERFDGVARAARNVAVCAAGEWLGEPVGDVMCREVLAGRGAREA